MHIAIDDTYGPNIIGKSKYVTGSRRSHVAVFFPDNEVDEIRTQLRSMLEYVESELSIQAEEFHFTDIYNRRGVWANCKQGENIAVFQTFAQIYSQYKWKIEIQTIDDRTFSDHGIKGFDEEIDGLDLSKRPDLSLAFLLLVKVKPVLRTIKGQSMIIVDEGIGTAGTEFGDQLFHDLGERVKCRFSTGVDEPLLQIADFFAYSINRSTHLAFKENRTDFDNSFLDLIGSMEINCPDINTVSAVHDFTADSADQVHAESRKKKGLE